jgi:hypothetical protein
VVVWGGGAMHAPGWSLQCSRTTRRAGNRKKWRIPLTSLVTSYKYRQNQDVTEVLLRLLSSCQLPETRTAATSSIYKDLGMR